MHCAVSPIKAGRNLPRKPVHRRGGHKDLEPFLKAKYRKGGTVLKTDVLGLIFLKFIQILYGGLVLMSF